MKHLSKRPHTVNGGLFDIPTTVDELFHRFWNAPAARHDVGWHPPVDIVETPQAYVLSVELPGVTNDSIEVTVTGDTLVLRGEKMRAERPDGDALRMEERTFGTFERTFTFPTHIATDSIDAHARDGILTITVKKAEETQPRKIQIKA